VGRRRGDNQEESADDFDARVKTLQQAVRVGDFCGVKRLLHGAEKTGQGAFKKVHGIYPVRV
jgi:hypothetical protein